MGHLQSKHQNKMSDSDLRSFIETQSLLTEWIVPTEFMGLWDNRLNCSFRFPTIVCERKSCCPSLILCLSPFISTARSTLCMCTAVKSRAVESESLKVGKSLKIGKKSDKIGKIGFDILLDFLAKMPKCHKCHEMP